MPRYALVDQAGNDVGARLSTIEVVVGDVVFDGNRNVRVTNIVEPNLTDSTYDVILIVEPAE